MRILMRKLSTGSEHDLAGKDITLAVLERRLAFVTYREQAPYFQDSNYEICVTVQKGKFSPFGFALSGSSLGFLPAMPESVVSLPPTMFFYYGYNAQPVKSVNLISVALIGLSIRGTQR